VEEKVNRVNLLANSVKSSYPNERSNVNARQKEVQDLWEKVKAKAMERRSRLEDAVGHQIFINSSKNLVSDTVDSACTCLYSNLKSLEVCDVERRIMVLMGERRRQHDMECVGVLCTSVFVNTDVIKEILG
jgi:hypothetical protein